MARKRDYRAEYERRIASATKRGLSLSQARGHARSGEPPVRRPSAFGHDDRLEAALKELLRSRNQASAAKAIGIAPERFRRFLHEKVTIEGRGRSLKITDRRHRIMPVISGGEIRERTLLDFDQASLNGRYLNAVRTFLNENDAEFLAPFVGRSVIDATGKAHVFETNPSRLYRLADAGSEVFHNIYRLVI